MSDFLLESFISECKDIASGLDRLGSKWPKTYEESSFTRNMVKEELDYRLYRYQSVDNSRKKTLKKKIKTVNQMFDVQADFWNGDPDIDAICRMEHAPECNFDSSYFPFTSTIFPLPKKGTQIGLTLSLTLARWHVGTLERGPSSPASQIR